MSKRKTNDAMHAGAPKPRTFPQDPGNLAGSLYDKFLLRQKIGVPEGWTFNGVFMLPPRVTEEEWEKLRREDRLRQTTEGQERPEAKPLWGDTPFDDFAAEFLG